ncbi:peptidase S8 [Tersicoccus solisilvae]|uniref:Peptidase S8 n=1 Tax=Tersicoccus solisilvae TaxID=1882339 RepID=A0ABQ1P7F9_9MICC|nr:S8 family serine peptidase [Tersicoccus solisilvae]GGC90378.1 peptidase S8 [Tersicoccus solisilvae]
MADQKSDPTTPAPGLKSQPVKATKISPRLASASGQISVFVQFTGQGAFDRTQPVAVKRGTQKPLAKAAEVRSIRASIQAAGRAAASAAGAQTLYTTTNTIPGVALRGDAAALRALAQQANVVKITPIVTKKVNNKGTDIDTRALDSWVQQKATGEGTTIAVIDTGIDYTHTDFGGPGTAAAFTQAKGSSTVPAGLFDGRKFAGGYDLVGDDYNADPDDPAYQPVPKPDGNPLDCNGHGSHVAGTAAGYGVASDGSTFGGGTGNYGALTAATVNAMRIGPGSAPKAKLVGLRVFGCEGSSDVVGDALDRVLDPNGDGDFSDRAQIVNMSLGSDWSPTDDPENAIVDNLTDQNILSVVASGNAGDSYDIGGSPGNARSSLTVANSIGSQVTLDRIDVLAPSGVAGAAQGQYSVNFDYNAAGVTQAQLTGTVIAPPAGTTNPYGCSNADGSNPFPANSLAGKWVWLQWEDASGTFPCGSVARFNNAQAAGAKGVVLDSPRDVFDAGISGNATIPGVQLNRTSSDKLRPAATAGTLQVRLSPDYIGTADGPSGQKDQLNSSSSRGVHGSNGIVKPDVAAAGTLIGSAAVGSGNKPNVKTGTSMATPHVAGIAALVRGKYPFLTATQTKALVMNTANRDVVTADGAVYGPNRVGSGRVDALDALNSPAYAFAAADPTLTSVSFGVLEVADQPVTVTKNVTVRNNTTTAITYAAAYRASSTVPGVTYTVPASVAVPAAGSATVPVTMTISDPKALAKSKDPSLEAVQGGVTRQFMAEAAGRLTLTAAGKPSLRVPVYASVKPVSAMSAGTVAFGADPTSTLVPLSGRGTTQSGFNAVVGGFQLGAGSTRLPASTQPQRDVVDLQYVGANSSVPAVAAAKGDVAENGVVNFGISTWANAPALAANTEFDVEVDTNRDGKADFLTVLTRLTDVDLAVASTYEIVNGKLSADPVDLQAVNGQTGEVDTNTFDTNAFSLPVRAAAFKLDLTKSAPVQYRVSTFNGYSSAAIDSTSWIAYNLTQPNVAFGNADGSVLFADVPGTGLPAQRTAAGASTQALFLHLHNATGDLSGKGTDDGGKAQVVPVTVTSAPPAATPSIPSRSTVTTVDRSGRLLAYPATGTGKLGTPKDIMPGSNWSTVVSTTVIDWNQDGVLDIVSHWKSGVVAVYTGKSGGGFNAGATVATGWTGWTVVAAAGANGRPGLYTIETNGDLRFRGTGSTGKLAASGVRIGGGWKGFELTPADFDRNGTTDLLARNTQGHLLVYKASSTGLASAPAKDIGKAWDTMSSIVAREGFTGSGSLSVLGIDRDGNLRNYRVVNQSLATPDRVGGGWTGYRLSE